MYDFNHEQSHCNLLAIKKRLVAYKMHFYKPVTYTVKFPFSILEKQAIFLLSPIACCRFIKSNYESDRSFTTVTVMSATLRPEYNTTNWKKTKLVSKFINFKISFNFTLKCSCQCKQSMLTIPVSCRTQLICSFALNIP